ncbi:MAG TPA: hypothetical protein VJ276_18035 [Thermoanaerobaculia bacterium]|nr:hypothetical protein [Thermoanaerobaculia bacterium]
MKTVLAMFLTLAMAVTASAHAEEPKSDAEVALQKMMAELRQVPSDMKLIDESNANLAISNLDLAKTTKTIDKEARAMKDEEVPALIKRAQEFDDNIQVGLDRGCGAKQTTDPELAKYCNTANDEAAIEKKKLEEAQADLLHRMQMIPKRRKDVEVTTLANFEAKGKNDRARDALRSRQQELYSQIITRSMSLITSKAAATKACVSLPPEEATCCLRVVSDGENPALCGVERLFKLFENAGVFSTSEVRLVK